MGHKCGKKKVPLHIYDPFLSLCNKILCLYNKKEMKICEKC